MSSHDQAAKVTSTHETQPLSAKDAETPCCDATKKATCCEPKAKGACCGPSGAGKKGCC